MPNVSFCEDDRDIHYNPYVEQPFFCKLTLNDDSVVNIEGSGQLTDEMTSVYSETCVSAEIGELCTSIGLSTFASFIHLKKLIIGDNVTYIDTDSIIFCASLTNVTIGSGITAIGGGVFAGCSGLSSVTVEASNPPRFYDEDVSGLPFVNTNNCPIYVPSESVNTYKSASGWSTYASRIQAKP